jgi:hypothetical protein
VMYSANLSSVAINVTKSWLHQASSVRIRTKLSALVILTLASCSTGCLHPRIGPQSLPRDRAAYSSSLSDSWKEETLLNIVKVRYLDPPVFVDIGSMWPVIPSRRLPRLGERSYRREAVARWWAVQ